MDADTVGTAYLDPATGDVYRLDGYRTDRRPQPFTGEATVATYSVQLTDGSRALVDALPEGVVAFWRPATDAAADEPEHATVRPGLYTHFKGNRYEVLSVARSSETGEEMVVYRALYGDFGLWVRPAAMFVETVERDGRTMPRFAREDAR